MKKYLITAILLTIFVILLGTNPEYMSTPSLMLVIMFMSLSGVFGMRLLTARLKGRFGRAAQDAADNNILDMRSLSLGALAVIFLFFLNLAGSLSIRDFLLALILSVIAHFYLEKKLRRS